jgi:hypothetical protein
VRADRPPAAKVQKKVSTAATGLGAALGAVAAAAHQATEAAQAGVPPTTDDGGGGASASKDLHSCVSALS